MCPQKFPLDQFQYICKTQPRALVVRMERPLIYTSLRQLRVSSAMRHFIVVCSVPWPLDRSEAEVLSQTFLLFTCKSCYSHVNKPVSVVINMSKTVACKQSLRGALAAGREKERELATTSLEFEYLRRNAVWRR